VNTVRRRPESRLVATRQVVDEATFSFGNVVEVYDQWEISAALGLFTTVL
jgi:DNA-binding transcriptional MocR family regulator